MAKQGGYDLVLTGKETIDYNGSSIGGMVAELLDLPYISLATKFELAGGNATITREIEGGEEVIETITKIIGAGMPVMGHLGLMPQSINKYGTYGVRAKGDAEAE